MTGGDDDIAESLPRPPLPAPARREAAIAEALRRFDGAEPARASEESRAARPAPWWSPQRRPYAGALAGAFLVALIGLPFVWTSFDRTVPGGGGERAPAVEEAGPASAMADSHVSGIDPAPPGPPAGTQPAPADLARTGPIPAPAGSAGEGPVGKSEEPAAASGAQDAAEVVVTGARVRHPDLTSASPVTVVGGDDNITVTGTRSSHAAPRRRGDWNACTIDDPGRSAAACRKRDGPAAGGASGRAADRVSEGVSSAWEGDLDSAIESFDRAIELEPRSSAAYLNRALAWRRRGDLDRALADLDRAVRFSPRAARYYYHRSLVLRQRGDKKRAQADEERAVALDPRYAVAVRGGE